MCVQKLGEDWRFAALHEFQTTSGGSQGTCDAIFRMYKRAVEHPAPSKRSMVSLPMVAPVVGGGAGGAAGAGGVAVPPAEGSSIAHGKRPREEEAAAADGSSARREPPSACHAGSSATSSTVAASSSTSSERREVEILQCPFSDLLKTLLDGMLSIDPARRIDLRAVNEHRWLDVTPPGKPLFDENAFVYRGIGSDDVVTEPPAGAVHITRQRTPTYQPPTRTPRAPSGPTAPILWHPKAHPRSLCRHSLCLWAHPILACASRVRGAAGMRAGAPSAWENPIEEKPVGGYSGFAFHRY